MAMLDGQAVPEILLKQTNEPDVEIAMALGTLQSFRIDFAGS